MRVARWWRPENVPPVPAGDDDSVAEAFLALYAQAVEDRVRVPHPVGVHLSGGLDSSSVAVLPARALQRMGQPAPRFFSWHPPPGDDAPDAAEHALIEAVSRQENLPVFYCPPSTTDVLASLRRDVTRDANSHVNESPVQRRAAGQGVRVLLSGWGGDESVSFDGRGYYPELLRSGRLGTLWREVRETGRHPLAGIMLGAVLPLIAPAAPAALARLRRGRWPAPRRTYIHPAFARRTRLLPPAPPRPPAYEPCNSTCCKPGTSAPGLTGGRRAARATGSSTGTRCWTAACWSSPWACRRSSSGAEGGAAG